MGMKKNKYVIRFHLNYVLIPRMRNANVDNKYGDLENPSIPLG